MMHYEFQNELMKNNTGDEMCITANMATGIQSLFPSHFASHSISFPQRIGINSLSPMGWGGRVEQNEESANGALKWCS